MDDGGKVHVVPVSTGSLKRKIATWAKKAVEEQPSFSLPAVAGHIVKLAEAEPDYATAVADEFVYPAVYDVLQRVVAKGRRHTFVGEEVMTLEEARERATADAREWMTRWFEFTGSRHVRLEEMRRPDLLAAAAIRERRGRHELAIAAIWRKAAERLPDDERQLGTAMTNAELDDLADRLRLGVTVDWADPAPEPEPTEQGVTLAAD